MDLTSPERGPIDLEDRFPGKNTAAARAEREKIGFVRQPMTRWLDPALLAGAAMEVAVSSAFGRLADKRESLVNPGEPVDYSDREELWLDFLSDTGDGFHSTYTMAWLLAQRQLEVESAPVLPRGELLILGGDQVYPSASVEAYEDHFLGPFSAALWSEDEEAAPHMWAVPGNHDWYDGLTSFLRVFCRGGWVGGWRTHQGRSYFALPLPHGWWLWAIDIQFDTYLDSRQLDYFAEAGKRLAAGDKVLLVTAKPSWGRAEDDVTEPASWRYLSYFEEKYVRARGARLAATLTGDLHHYSRYEPVAGDAPDRITAGGGGAYLSPTHTLPDRLKLRSLAAKQPVSYECKATYPSRDRSRKLRWGALLLGLRNPGFARMMGVVYTLLAATSLAALNSGRGSLVGSAERGSFFDFVGTALGGATIVVVFVLALGLVLYADAGWFPMKVLVGSAHAAVHLFVLELALWLVLSLFEADSPGWRAWLVALPVAFAVGFALAPLVFAKFLLGISVVRGKGALNHANEVFASQALTGYKNFLRLHIAPGGELTIYPLGVERACEQWDVYPREGAHARPHFSPRGDAPRAELIEAPLTYS